MDNPGAVELAIRYRPLDALVPYARNARRHSPTQISKIKASLLEFGWANPMLIANDEMIAGHARLEAAQSLLAEGKVIPFAADPLQGPTVDLSHLTPSQRRAYILADNRLAEEAVWDLDLLRVELDGLKLDGGFDVTLAGFSVPEINTIMRGWNTDFSRQDATEASLDPLIGLLRIRYRRADEQAVMAALAEALKSFDGIEIKQY